MSDWTIGRTKDNKQFQIKDYDRFYHTIIIGPTGCGKTSKLIKPGIWQDLIEIKKKRLKYEALQKEAKYRLQLKINKIKSGDSSPEKKAELIQKAIEEYTAKINSINRQEYIQGLTVVEPKGDLADDVAQLCQKLNLPYIYLNPLDPNTDKFNIMEGDADVVAEANRTVLRNMFGKQEQFFALIQETTARNMVLLMKRLVGDKLDLLDVSRALRSLDELKRYVDEYERKKGTDDLVAFYRSEVFGTLQDKFYQFAMGLRQQLEDLGQNKYLRNILIGKSSINLDKHLAEGGILIVNTAMGTLGRLGDIFGQFVIMHIQSAVFRRPGTEFTRPYHHLWIDEAPRYMNPDFERLLAIGRSFRCSVNMALQSLDQLVLEEKMAFKNIVMTNCRNQIIFGGLSKDDALYFEDALGKDETYIKQYTYKYNKLVPINLLPKTFRTSKKEMARFRYTDIMEMPISREFADVIAKYVRYGALQKPEIVTTSLHDYKTPKEITELEHKATDEYWQKKFKLDNSTTTNTGKPISSTAEKQEQKHEQESQEPGNRISVLYRLICRLRRQRSTSQKQPDQPHEQQLKQPDQQKKISLSNAGASYTFVETESLTGSDTSSPALTNTTHTGAAESVDKAAKEVTNVGTADKNTDKTNEEHNNKLTKEEEKKLLESYITSTKNQSKKLKKASQESIQDKGEAKATKEKIVIINTEDFKTSEESELTNSSEDSQFWGI